jgi:hypothetical protein
MHTGQEAPHTHRESKHMTKIKIDTDKDANPFPALIRPRKQSRPAATEFSPQYEPLMPLEVDTLTAVVAIRDTCLIEAQTLAWGAGWSYGTIDHQLFGGDCYGPDIWEMLDYWLGTIYARIDGEELMIKSTVMNAGLPPLPQAVSFVQSRQGRGIKLLGQKAESRASRFCH